MADDVELEQLDEGVRGIVGALRRLQGIRTLGSCEGHENPSGGQWEAGTWYVTFDVTDCDPPCGPGWLALEWVAWAVDAAGRDAVLRATAPAPYLNEPGRCLRFAIEGTGDPRAFGAFLARVCNADFADYLRDLQVLDVEGNAHG